MKAIQIFLIVFSIALHSSAQETTTYNLTFEEGLQRILDENLQLLSAHYDIELSEAEIIQAGLWDNPLFVYNAEMYSMAQNSYFNFGNQQLIQLEYSFSISGKRVNAIREARVNKEIAILAMTDVIRGLYFEYSIHYYNLIALREKNKTIQKVYDQFQSVIELNQRKLELGVISENDLTRLRAENIALLTEINSNKNEIEAEEEVLSILLNINKNVEIIPQSVVTSELTTKSIDELVELAKIYRPDYKMALKYIDFYEATLKKQKSEAIPNINLGYQPLDKGSNHVRPYSGMVFEMSIPIFNRNQGNIQAAKIGIDQSKNQVQQKELELFNEVFSAYNQVQNSQSLFETFNTGLISTMKQLSDNAKLNYEKRNISLIEYIDYQRAYIENEKNWIDVVNTYHQNINQLNFVVGKTLKP